MSRRCWPALIIAVALVSGCTEHSQPTIPSSTPKAVSHYANWPVVLNDFRFHWSAAPGIELNAGPGVALRAYIESYEAVAMAVDINAVYPGFWRATPENQPMVGNYMVQFASVRPFPGEQHSDPARAVQHFGYNSEHILEIAPTSSGYRAIVCSGSYANFTNSSSKPGTYLSTASKVTADGVEPSKFDWPYSGIAVLRIELNQREPASGGRAPLPQRGPAPAPGGDVFGSWFVTASSSHLWGAIGSPQIEDFPSVDLRKRCSDAMPDNEDARRDLMTGYKDHPPAPGDAMPGWPL
jgi:hypothetical protein